MSALERFLHFEHDGMPVVVMAGSHTFNSKRSIRFSTATAASAAC